MGESDRHSEIAEAEAATERDDNYEKLPKHMYIPSVSTRMKRVVCEGYVATS